MCVGCRLATLQSFNYKSNHSILFTFIIVSCELDIAEKVSTTASNIFHHFDGKKHMTNNRTSLSCDIIMKILNKMTVQMEDGIGPTRVVKLFHSSVLCIAMENV